MAIYRGREVRIVNYVQPDLTIPDTIQVVDKDGQSYSPKVSEVQFTEAEKKDLKNYHTDRFNQVNVIKDEDLKKLRDDSDPKVIEKRQADAAAKAQKPTPVTLVEPDQRVM
jgi:hypothetical protein